MELLASVGADGVASGRSGYTVRPGYIPARKSCSRKKFPGKMFLAKLSSKKYFPRARLLRRVTSTFLAVPWADESRKELDMREEHLNAKGAKSVEG